MIFLHPKKRGDVFGGVGTGDLAYLFHHQAPVFYFFVFKV